MKNTSFAMVAAVSIGFFGTGYAATDSANPAKKEVSSPPTVTSYPSQTEQVDIGAGKAILTIELKFRNVETSVKGVPMVRYTTEVIVTRSTPEGFWPFLLGDKINQIDNKYISHPKDLLFIFRDSAGATFNFEVVRKGKVIQFKAGPKEFPGLALPPTPEPPVPPTPPSRS